MLPALALVACNPRLRVFLTCLCGTANTPDNLDFLIVLFLGRLL